MLVDCEHRNRLLIHKKEEERENEISMVVLSEKNDESCRLIIYKSVEDIEVTGILIAPISTDRRSIISWTWTNKSKRSSHLFLWASF